MVALINKFGRTQIGRELLVSVRPVQKKKGNDVAFFHFQHRANQTVN